MPNFMKETFMKLDWSEQSPGRETAEETLAFYLAIFSRVISLFAMGRPVSSPPGENPTAGDGCVLRSTRPLVG